MALYWPHISKVTGCGAPKGPSSGGKNCSALAKFSSITVPEPTLAHGLSQPKILPPAATSAAPCPQSSSFCCTGPCCLFPPPSVCCDFQLGLFLNFHTWGEKSASRQREERGARGVAGLKGRGSKALSCLTRLCRSSPRVIAGPRAK